MPDLKALEIAKNELDDLIVIGEKLIVIAGSARSNLMEGQLTDAMAWVSRSGSIIRKVSGDESEYARAFQTHVRDLILIIFMLIITTTCVKLRGHSKAYGMLLTLVCYKI